MEENAMTRNKRLGIVLFATLAVFSLLLVACGPAVEEEPEKARWEEKIVIGWTPPDITGVFKTATDFFELSAADGVANGFDIEVISQSPATHIDFADQVGIIEDYITREVDVIAISPIEVEMPRGSGANLHEHRWRQLKGYSEA